MIIYNNFKKYFIGSKKTIFINLLITIFCFLFVFITNNTIYKKNNKEVELKILDFPHFLSDSLFANLYDLKIKNYFSQKNDDLNFRTLIFSWNKNELENDLKTKKIIKQRIIRISNRYLILLESQIDKIKKDYPDCLIYLYNNMNNLPQEILTAESNRDYVLWFIDNYDKLTSFKKIEANSFKELRIFNIFYSTVFLSILIIIIINFVRFEKEKL
ncbi:hypothetical protein N9E71_03590 [Candidatus Pelagibacter sp.]|nr:hypothetical protein [Candidatus Pelagibacter sp.]